MNTQNIFRTTETQIGGTIYIVKTMPSERATETVERKLVRLVAERISAELKASGNALFVGKTACN